VAVSFNRPYGKYCQILDAPLSTGSGEFFLWEFPLAFWLEEHGYDVTYISNLDTHHDPGGLMRARGFLSVGHDEYYSIEMFNASTCWWADGLSEPPGYVRPSVYTSPQGPDSRVQRITRNLLERMKRL